MTLAKYVQLKMQKNPISKRPNLYEFESFSPYLKEMFVFQKHAKKVFSYSIAAKKMKISVGFLKNIVAGRRSIDINLITSLARVLELSDEERRFLTVLIVRDQLTDNEKLLNVVDRPSA